MNKLNILKSRQRHKKRRLKIALWLHNYKKTLKCTKCGENHPATLDFHHRDPKDKIGSIAHSSCLGWGMKKLLKEIAKCDVLCANCHRKLHYKEPLPL